MITYFGSTSTILQLCVLKMASESSSKAVGLTNEEAKNVCKEPSPETKVGILHSKLYTFSVVMTQNEDKGLSLGWCYQGSTQTRDLPS